MANKVVCPICGHDDQIQKVSAIVQNGTQSYQASGPTIGTAYAGGKWGLATGVTTVSGTTQTALASKLMPPAEPKGVNGLIYLFLVLPLGTGYVGLQFLAMGLFGYPRGTIWQEVLVIAACALLILLSLWGLVLFSRSLKTEQSKVAKRKAAWQQALAVWNRLFYCYRDDLVFDPATGRSCPPSQMNSLLY